MAVAMLLLALAAAAAAAVAEEEGGVRYGFYRGGSETGRGGRRVFGGQRAQADGARGAACALLDRYWTVRCSGAVLAPRWALTAAHCVTPRLAYVRYNARRHHDGDVQPALFLYRHPEFKVVEEDAGQGADVTLLHHDVGLVRTRDDMVLRRQALAPLRTISLYDAMSLQQEEVEVVGFGRTERSALSEELYAARLRLVACGRGGWLNCVCGAARGGAGVCAGDSGGPVLYRGVQVGVTSMGPLECARGVTPDGGTSVFTALARYAALINSTMHATDSSLRMQRVSSAPRPRPALPPLLPLLLLISFRYQYECHQQYPRVLLHL